MNKTTLIAVLLLLVTQFNFSQNIYTKVILNDSSLETINQFSEQEIDFRHASLFDKCGYKFCKFYNENTDKKNKIK